MSKTFCSAIVLASVLEVNTAQGALVVNGDFENGLAADAAQRTIDNGVNATVVKEFYVNAKAISIESVAVVPEPSTMMAGAAALIAAGVSAARTKRNRRPVA